MPSPIELALTSLLPTASFLSPELIDLATSLVAQSRYKAASLKPEEEIGRIYACCQIASERSQKRLALDVSKPSPPCPPRVYNKLLKYLQSVLIPVPTTPRSSRTISKIDGTPTTETRHANTPSGTTPSRKRGNESPFTTPVTANHKRKIDDVQQIRSLAADQIMPMIRLMCKALGEPRAAPHVFVGAEVMSITRDLTRGKEIGDSALRSPVAKRRATANARSNTATEQDGLSLEFASLTRLVALCSLVVRETAGQQDQDAGEQCRVALDAALSSEWARDLGAKQPKEEVLRAAAHAESETLYDECHELDWFKSIPRDSNSGALDDDQEEEALEQRHFRPYKTPLRRKEKHTQPSVDGFEATGSAGLLPGLGTMFQPAVDWLSDERRRSLATFKQHILRQIAAAEQTS